MAQEIQECVACCKRDPDGLQQQIDELLAQGRKSPAREPALTKQQKMRIRKRYVAQAGAHSVVRIAKDYDVAPGAVHQALRGL